MARKKTSESQSKIFRFMCIRGKSGNYHLDFDTELAGTQYIEDLNTNDIEWYALYELDDKRDALKMICSKRIVPYNNTIKLPRSEAPKSKSSNKPRKKPNS